MGRKGHGYEADAYGMQQRYTVPNQSYSRPSHGYAPPQHGFAPPTQSYKAPQRGQLAGQLSYHRQPATVVVQQPLPAGTVIHQNAVRNYLGCAILACLLCFWPTGVCAIHYARRSRELLAEGNIEESTRLARNARNLIIASVVLGILSIASVVVRFVIISNSPTTYSG